MSYDKYVNDAMIKVKKGERLLFINQLYWTKEVCLAAVKYESSYSYALTDFKLVPMGNLEYVMKHMREIKKKSSTYIRELEATYLKRKEEEKKPDYYGDFKSYQDLLNYFKAKDYDDILRKRFEIIENKS